MHASVLGNRYSFFMNEQSSGKRPMKTYDMGLEEHNMLHDIQIICLSRDYHTSSTRSIAKASKGRNGNNRWAGRNTFDLSRTGTWDHPHEPEDDLKRLSVIRPVLMKLSTDLCIAMQKRSTHCIIQQLKDVAATTLLIQES